MACFWIFAFFSLCRIELVIGEENDLSKATIQFGINILKAIGNTSENAFFSPASISACIGMVYEGSAGHTKSQINNALYNNLTDQEVKDQMKDLTLTLNDETHLYNLSFANRLYANKKFAILKDYLNILETYFQSEIKSVDFANDAESIRKEINSWTDEKTNHKIKDLFPPNSLNGSTLVLVNAIYFKGSWAYKFSESDTSSKPFYATKNKKTDVKMMKQTNVLMPYFETSDVQVLGLPYVGETLVMYIILPKERYGLGQIESNLSSGIFQKWMHNAGETEVAEIQIPKFKLEKELQLVDIMKQLGMTDMFDFDKADLSAIDGKRDLRVSKASHKAFIEVNEMGTEAAALTGIIVMEGPSINTPPPPPRFVADHPFLFVIVERNSFTPFFFGRFVGS